jgi:hypothetical protein
MSEYLKRELQLRDEAGRFERLWLHERNPSRKPQLRAIYLALLTEGQAVSVRDLGDLASRVEALADSVEADRPGTRAAPLPCAIAPAGWKGSSTPGNASSHRAPTATAGSPASPLISIG